MKPLNHSYAIAETFTADDVIYFYCGDYGLKCKNCIYSFDMSSGLSSRFDFPPHLDFDLMDSRILQIGKTVYTFKRCSFHVGVYKLDKIGSPNFAITWLTPLKRRSHGFAIAAHARCDIYLSGGGNEERYNFHRDQVCKYSISENRWTSMPRMNQARSWHSSMVLANHLYVMGGINVKSIESLMIGSNAAAA